MRSGLKESVQSESRNGRLFQEALLAMEVQVIDGEAGELRECGGHEKLLV